MPIEPHTAPGLPDPLDTSAAGEEDPGAALDVIVAPHVAGDVQQMPLTASGWPAGATAPGFFEGFTLANITLSDATLRVRYGGAGPPLLLLHGHPRTHATWHRLAPLLARHHTVICPDLRGFGASSKPVDAPDHAGSSKRAKAADMVELMRHFGHERFAVAGHDRGAYVAFRAAMDHPEAITHLAMLEAVPIIEALERCHAEFAQRWWHWFFYAQPEKPERAILVNPSAWYGGDEHQMGAEAFADYRQAIHDPATVHAMLEDHRAGLGIDRLHDEQDRAAGRQLQCPVLALWAQGGDLDTLYGDVLSVWRAWAPDLRGQGLKGGHHLAEDNPVELAAALLEFLSPVH